MSQVEKNKILVVDDDRQIRQLFLQMITISMPDIRVDVATNGKEAVTMFKELDYNVIVMDVIMPVMDGEQAFHEIKKICTQNNKEMPSVIFCTGYAPTNNIISLADSDPRHYIVHKPVGNKGLVDVIKQRLVAE